MKVEVHGCMHIYVCACVCAWVCMLVCVHSYMHGMCVNIQQTRCPVEFPFPTFAVVEGRSYIFISVSPIQSCSIDTFKVNKITWQQEDFVC